MASTFEDLFRSDSGDAAYAYLQAIAADHLATTEFGIYLCRDGGDKLSYTTVYHHGEAEPASHLNGQLSSECRTAFYTQEPQYGTLETAEGARTMAVHPLVMNGDVHALLHLDFQVGDDALQSRRFISYLARLTVILLKNDLVHADSLAIADDEGDSPMLFFDESHRELFNELHLLLGYSTVELKEITQVLRSIRTLLED